MFDVHFWTTPDCFKILILMEEAGLDYRIHPVNVNKGAQFRPDFRKLSPDHKIPAVVDNEPTDEAGPLTLLESCAILEYLAIKTGRFLPTAIRPRAEVLQWLYWQSAALGPILTQSHHFNELAPKPIGYAINHYIHEATRLYAHLDRHLEDRPYIAGDYSIADIACYPWIVLHKTHRQDLDDYPNIRRWYHSMRARNAVQDAYAKGLAINSKTDIDDIASTRLLHGYVATTRH